MLVDDAVHASTATRVERADRIPYYVEQAVRTALVRPARRGVPRPARRRHPRPRRRGRGARARRRCPTPPRSQAADADVAARARRPADAPSARSSSSARAWPGRAPRTRCARSSRRTRLPFLDLADGQGRDARRPPAVGRRGALARAAERRPRPPARRPAQLDHALRPAAALRPGRARHPARHLAPSRSSTNVPTEVGARRRRQGGDGPAQRGARTRDPWSYPAETPWRRARSPTRSTANRGADRGAWPPTTRRR